MTNSSQTTQPVVFLDEISWHELKSQPDNKIALSAAVSKYLCGSENNGHLYYFSKLSIYGDAEQNAKNIIADFAI